MGHAKTVDEVKDRDLYGIICAAQDEVISAISSLNMHPEPRDPPDGEYLADLDNWANHAQEHATAATRILSHLRQYLPSLIDSYMK
jgi:hypothetical protein